MPSDYPLGYVPGKIEEVYTVADAFDRWRLARQKCQQLETAVGIEQELGIMMYRYPVDPRDLRAFYKWVVEEYRRWFQQILIGWQLYNRQEKRQTVYQVYAHWDINDPTAVADDCFVYRPPIIFDTVREIPPLGRPTICLMFTYPQRETYQMFPVPVDYVTRVEGCVVVPPNPGN